MQIDQSKVQNFVEVFREYNHKIYGYVYMRTGQNQTIAEDLTQEVFTKAWQHRHKFDPSRSSIKTWLYTIAHHSVVDYLRKSKIDSISLEKLDQHATELTSEIDNRIMADHIFANLAKLEIGEQELIMLRYGQELEIAEIATIIGKNHSATKVALYRAVQKLKEIINV